jgi:hypothetical protein
MGFKAGLAHRDSKGFKACVVTRDSVAFRVFKGSGGCKGLKGLKGFVDFRVNVGSKEFRDFLGFRVGKARRAAWDRKGLKESVCKDSRGFKVTMGSATKDHKDREEVKALSVRRDRRELSECRGMKVYKGRKVGVVTKAFVDSRAFGVFKEFRATRGNWVRRDSAAIRGNWVRRDSAAIRV